MRTPGIPRDHTDGVSATTTPACVTLLICCLPGVLFLRGAAVPHHLCRILPPVLSVPVDHAGATGLSAPAGGAAAHRARHRGLHRPEPHLASLRAPRYRASTPAGGLSDARTRRRGASHRRRPYARYPSDRRGHY